MDRVMEQKVRLRAYEEWMAAGMTDGSADEHWFLAERSVLGETATIEAVRDDAEFAVAKPSDAKSAKTAGAKAPKAKAAKAKTTSGAIEAGTAAIKAKSSAGTKAKSGAAVRMAKGGSAGSMSASA